MAFKVVKFGEKDVALKSTAATALRFKQIFNFDLLKTLTKIKLDGKEDGEKVDEALDTSELITKLGFIMAKQAEKADFSSLNINSYYDWLDEFEHNTIPYVDIMTTYKDNEIGEVEAKKAPAEQSEN